MSKEIKTLSQPIDDFARALFGGPLHIPTRASGTVIRKYSGCYVIQRLLQIIFCFKEIKEIEDKDIKPSNENIKTCFNLFWSNNCMFADKNEVIWPAYWIAYEESIKKRHNLKLIDYINLSITDNIFISRLTCITNTSNSQDKRYLIANRYVSVLADSIIKVGIDGTYNKVIDLITIKKARQQSIASCMLAVENDVIHYFSVKSSTDDMWIEREFIQFITGWVDDKFISDALVFYIPKIFIRMLFISIQDPTGIGLVDEMEQYQVQTYYIPAKLEFPEITDLLINFSAIGKYYKLLNDHIEHDIEHDIEHVIVPNSNILFFAWFFETYMLYEGIGVSAKWPVDMGFDTQKEVNAYNRKYPEEKIGPIKYDFETEKTSLILKMCIAILSDKSISILLMNGYNKETYTETMLNVISTFSTAGAFIKTEKIEKDAAADVVVDHTAAAAAAVGEDNADMQVLKKYISTHPICSTSGCSTSGCSTSGCSTSGCSTSGCSTSGCSTSGCSTSGCSTSGCSEDTASEKSRQPSTKLNSTFLPLQVMNTIKGFLGPEFTVGFGENHTRKRNNRKPRTKKQFRHQSKKSNKNIKVKPNNRTNNIRQNNKKPFKKIVK